MFECSFLKKMSNFLKKWVQSRFLMSKIEKGVKKVTFCCHILSIKTTLCDTSFDIRATCFRKFRHLVSSFAKVATLEIHENSLFRQSGEKWDFWDFWNRQNRQMCENVKKGGQNLCTFRTCKKSAFFKRRFLTHQMHGGIGFWRLFCRREYRRSWKRLGPICVFFGEKNTSSFLPHLFCAIWV